LFKFGWLTITAEDLAIWEEFPNAAFTLYSAAAGTTAEPGGETEEETGEEFRLVTFELWQNILLSEKGGPTQRPPSGGPPSGGPFVCGDERLLEITGIRCARVLANRGARPALAYRPLLSPLDR
jgi:hypothetical protein